MKKFIVPVIIAAALIVGGVITAVVINKSIGLREEEIVEIVPELTYGKYYLDGNADSGLWLELTENTIELCGDDLKKSFAEAVKKHGGIEGDEAESQINELMNEYCSANPYVVTRSIAGMDSGILINWSVVDEEQHRYTGTGYSYDINSKTINLGLFGDFALVN